MKKPRILLADDHPDMLSVLCDVFEDGLGEVVGMVRDGHALVEAAQRLKPDVIISDISMPGLNGLDATRALQSTVPQSKVIILTVYREPVYVSLAFKAGARGYILKRSAHYGDLSQALRQVLAGERYYGEGVREKWVPVEGVEAPTERPQ